jgi:hypothetical protein
VNNKPPEGAAQYPGCLADTQNQSDKSGPQHARAPQFLVNKVPEEGQIGVPVGFSIRESSWLTALPDTCDCLSETNIPKNHSGFRKPSINSVIVVIKLMIAPMFIGLLP